MKQPTTCCCRHPDRFECRRSRGGCYEDEYGDECECCCHDRDEDGFTEWDDEEDRKRPREDVWDWLA